MISKALASLTNQLRIELQVLNELLLEYIIANIDNIVNANLRKQYYTHNYIDYLYALIEFSGSIRAFLFKTNKK